MVASTAPAAPLSKEHVFRSKLPVIDIPNHQPLAQYILQRASEFSEKPCLIDGPTGRELTYGEVELLSRRVAAGLANLGIQKGDVVMNLLPNCIEFVLTFLGTAILGAIVTTANPFYTPAELVKQVKVAGVKLIITQHAYVQKVSEIASSGVKVVLTDGHFENLEHFSVLTEADEKQCPNVDIDPDDVVALPFSSGTTGLPKGVMLTHKSLITNVAQQVDGENPNLYMTSEDCLICVLPMFHIYSLNSILLCSLRVGATLVIMQKFDLATFLKLVQKYKVTIAMLVPPVILALAKDPTVLNYDLSSIRMVQSGAAPLGKDLEDALRIRMPRAVIGQGYGMTEAGPVLTMSLSFAKYPFPVKSGSCGTVVRNAEIKVLDPDTGAALSYNKPGEICIRGAQIMKGYLNNPESTSLTIDEEGWLHTGDVGYVDEDDEVFIVDRVKEIIKFKGFQVPPAELEAILIAHPDIVDAAVVGQKDAKAGEVPVAFVVKKQESDISEEQVKEFVAKQVVFYKKLQTVYFVDTIPKNPSGKILRKDLRSRLKIAGLWPATLVTPKCM
ncbi:hypothetical protein O6H91_20G002800 [Diphasiastrum complanatum]|uniref:Uncharacterized protein n=1 Tax=Diphasiastrum complanatum TaxID=34168 RepID=A0ACC2AMB2_DIPCM|nr:hypothetical protein O6H91_20G002800 [Diphasiastrum complanatum]